MRKNDWYVLIGVSALILFSLYSLLMGSLYNMPESLFAAAVKWLNQPEAAAAAATATTAPEATTATSAPPSPSTPAAVKTQSPTPETKAEGAAAAKAKPLKAGEGKKVMAEEVF